MTGAGRNEGRDGFARHGERADRGERPERSDRGEREELLGLLPPRVAWDLPSGRHLHHKELLMRTIDNESKTSQHKDAAPAGPARRRVLRPVFLAPLTALAITGALVAGFAARGGDDGSGGAATVRTQPVAQVLATISEAALASDSGPVKDDQYVYVQSVTLDVDLTTGKLVTGPMKKREIWYSQQPGQARRLGYIREDGETFPINADLWDTQHGHGTPVGLSRPTYRWLASLPTDPDALLRYLYAKTPTTDGQERDQAVFDQIGELIAETITPPETAAALYKAAARIPGVTKAPDAVDAVGRRGIGIARTDTKYSERSEWVFDAEDFHYLGERQYLTKDTAIGKAGALISNSAVLRRAVVDKGGVRPTAGQLLNS